MALINWDSSFSLGIQEIDRQHQKLVNMINELNDAMSQGKSKEVLGKIINELVSYTRVHFDTEEKYFEQYGYEEKEPHKTEHEKFVQTIREFANDFKQGKVGLSIKLMSFLSDWLTKHIKGTDKKYSEFLTSKGLS